jgi:hypothetical protein
MGAGRPLEYKPEIADRICAEISTSSKSLRTICKPDDMPDVSTVFRWMRQIEEFREQYARAKEEQADYMVEEMLEIADDGSKDDTPFTGANHVQRDKLRIDTRKWSASKLKPKKYGDKLEHSGTVEVKQVTGMEVK